MNVMIKAILSSVLIMMSLVSFTNILAGKSNGIDSLESDNNRVQLITYIKEMQSQDSKKSYASHNEFLDKLVANSDDFETPSSKPSPSSSPSTSPPRSMSPSFPERRKSGWAPTAST